MSPPDDALKIPASVSAAVASPAAQVHTYAIALAVTVVDVKVFLSFSVTKAVCDAAAAVVPVPTAMCVIAAFVVSFIRDATKFFPAVTTRLSTSCTTSSFSAIVNAPVSFKFSLTITNLLV